MISKVFRFLWVAALTVACASADDTRYDFVYDDAGVLLERLTPYAEPELGQSAQALMAAPMGSKQLGMRYWDSERYCSAGLATQQCVIPNKKAIRYFVTGGNSSERAVVEGLLVAWYQSMVGHGLDQSANGWLFSEATGLLDPHLTLILQIGATPICPGSGTVGLSCFTGSTRALTALSGVSGSYNTWNGVPVLQLDYRAITGDAALTETQKTNLLIQMVWSGAGRFVGIGLEDAFDARCSSAARRPNDTCFVRDAQACAANGFGDTGNQSSFWIAGADCGT